MLKRLVKQRKPSRLLAKKSLKKKTGEYEAKTGDWKYSPKTGGSRPKREGWNLNSLF